MKIARRNTMQRVILDDFVDHEFDCNSNVIINARQSGKKYFNFKPLFLFTRSIWVENEKKRNEDFEIYKFIERKKTNY